MAGGKGGFEAGDGFVLTIPEGLGGTGHEGVERLGKRKLGDTATEGVVVGFGFGE